MTEKIDAHHHLWRYTPQEYEWLGDPGLVPLRRDFLLPQLRLALREAGVRGTVAVQARQTLEETRWLLGMAKNSTTDGEPEVIRGVVGWAPLHDRTIATTLEELKSTPSLKGMRHVLQAEPSGFMEDPAFNRGIAALTEAGLVYDLLITERQLQEAIALVDRHPQQVFVLDHIAKPKIAAGEREPWASGLRELARRQQVSCKLSGLVTEANWTEWTPGQLQPYLDVVLEAFGPERLMAGSDWPVCLVASGYGQWWQLLERFCEGLSETERDAIFGGAATGIYRL